MIGLWVENGDTDRARKQPADHERHEWAANAGGANIPKFGMPNAHSEHNKLYMPPNPLGPIIAEERTRANYIIVNCAYEDRNLEQQSAYGLLARKGWPTRYADALMLNSSVAWCKLRWIDSALFIWFYRRCPCVLDAISIVRPETVVRWHRKGFAAYWRRRILAKYAIYYNEVRTHVSLGKDAPSTSAIERFGEIIAHPILGGLHHRYSRI